MKNRLTVAILFSIFFLLIQGVAIGLDRENIEAYIIWHDKPISINLSVGKTRIVKFSNPIAFGMSQNLRNILSVKNNAGQLQLTALKLFQNKRVEVKDSVTGNVVLLNLSANNISEFNHSLEILYQKPTDDEVAKYSGWIKKPRVLQGEMSYITLVRFAEQQLYAPKRLLKNPYNIRLITSYVDHKNYIPKSQWFGGLFIDNSTRNLKWAQWYCSGYYVTAVLVRNQLSESIDLAHNITNLCGRDTGIWKALTFFPSWHLKSRGNLSDTTVAFLVSSIPFDQAISSCGKA